MRVLLLSWLFAGSLHAATHVETQVLPAHVEFRWTDDGRLLRTRLIRAESIHSVSFTRIEKGPNGRIDLTLIHPGGLEPRYEQVCLTAFSISRRRWRPTSGSRACSAASPWHPRPLKRNRRAVPHG